MKQFASLIYALGMLFFASRAVGEERLIQPNADLSPEQVIEIQLLGLQESKSDFTGIEQVWAFAHPANRKVTGPLERFARLFAYPAYAPMVGHRGYQYELMSEDGQTARFKVALTGRDGQAYTYLWELRKTTLNDKTAEIDVGLWMTTAVTAPRKGDAL